MTLTIVSTPLQNETSPFLFVHKDWTIAHILHIVNTVYAQYIFHLDTDIFIVVCHI